MRSPREWREIAVLVWPAALSSLLFTLLEVADAAMLGGVGVEAMAGALLGSTIVYLVLVLPLQTLRAMTPLAAQQAAAGAPLVGLRPLLGRASLFLGVPAAVLVLGAASLLPAFGYRADLLVAARTFLLWRAPFLPLEVAFLGAWAILEGLKGTRAPLGGGLATIAVNLVLNVLFISGHLGMPAMGVAGAALATGLATLVGFAILLIRLQPCWRAVASSGHGPTARRWWRAIRTGATVDPRLWRRFRCMGLPLGLAGLLESAGWLVMGLLIARTGVETTVTHGVLAQLLALGLALSQGVAAAGTVSVARAVGRQDLSRAGRSASRVLAAQLVLGLVLALAVLVSGRRWVRLFTDEAAVSAATGSLLPFLAGMMLVEGLVLVLYGIIEGGGRTRVLLRATLIFDVGFTALALLRLGPDAGAGSLYGAWLFKGVLKAGFLLAWLERDRWRALLGLIAPAGHRVWNVALRPWPVVSARGRWTVVVPRWALPAPDT